MLIRLHPIVQAASFLTTGRGTPKEKIILGGVLISAGLSVPGDWTPDLLERANGIYRSLLQGGSLKKTVGQMDENTANRCLKQLTKDTVELAAEIEQTMSQGRPHK